MKKLICILLTGTLAFASCSKDDPAPIAVGGISLNKAELTLKPQQSETLKATVTPEDATDKNVTWSSSDPKVATVDDSGKVTAVAAGSATITARAGEKSAACAVTVAWPVETVLIKAGTFMMGSPEDEAGRKENETLHKVTLTQDFYMGKYEVTNAQYAEFLNARKIAGAAAGETVPGEVKDYGTKLLFKVSTMTPGWNAETQMWECRDVIANRPMSYVSWYGALAYAQWAGGTLPTEAQWEYACRAGTTTAYFFGDDASKLGDYAISRENQPSLAGERVAAEVGTKLPNPWGLYDILGNVTELCLDTSNSSSLSPYSAEPATNPVNFNPEDQYTVSRGYGRGWNNDGSYFRSASRLYRNRNNDIVTGNQYDGFRVIFPAE